VSKSNLSKEIRPLEVDVHDGGSGSVAKEAEESGDDTPMPSKFLFPSNAHGQGHAKPNGVVFSAPSILKTSSSSSPKRSFSATSRNTTSTSLSSLAEDVDDTLHASNPIKQLHAFPTSPSLNPPGLLRRKSSSRSKGGSSNASTGTAESSGSSSSGAIHMTSGGVGGGSGELAVLEGGRERKLSTGKWWPFKNRSGVKS
jgi:hypothetical protein